MGGIAELLFAYPVLTDSVGDPPGLPRAVPSGEVASGGPNCCSISSRQRPPRLRRELRTLSEPSAGCSRPWLRREGGAKPREEGLSKRPAETDRNSEAGLTARAIFLAVGVLFLRLPPKLKMLPPWVFAPALASSFPSPSLASFTDAPSLSECLTALAPCLSCAAAPESQAQPPAPASGLGALVREERRGGGAGSSVTRAL
mmetsp:Transcript_73169/g.214451  ORF Transcript_73169/g.214451 Transcript_73169/m.214451 type:complete len:201 (-) Transcript_73169:1639-2241(-)